MSIRPDILCFPESDRVFCELVEGIVASTDASDWSELAVIDAVQSRLRESYPGATIRLRLPFATLYRSPRPTWYVFEDLSHRGVPRIMVVDDDDDFLDMVSALLSHEGYEVIRAGDVSAALASVATTPPDLILLDLVMPGGDGEEFMSAYCADPGPHAQVVVISGAKDAVVRADALGVRSFVPKPFDVPEFLALVGRYA